MFGTFRTLAFAALISTAAPSVDTDFATNRDVMDTSSYAGCLICITETSLPTHVHGYIPTSAYLCDTAEEREENPCNTCDEGGDHPGCHSSAAFGDCHGECTFADEDLVAAIEHQDPEAIAAAASSLNKGLEKLDRVILNQRRELIQVLDCKGAVRRQVPVSPELFPAIQEHLHHHE